MIVHSAKHSKIYFKRDIILFRQNLFRCRKRIIERDKKRSRPRLVHYRGGKRRWSELHRRSGYRCDKREVVTYTWHLRVGIKRDATMVEMGNAVKWLRQAAHTTGGSEPVALSGARPRFYCRHSRRTIKLLFHISRLSSHSYRPRAPRLSLMERQPPRTHRIPPKASNLTFSRCYRSRSPDDTEKSGIRSFDLSRVAHVVVSPISP